MLSALEFLEKAAARLQGKGAGGTTVKWEVAMALKALGREPKLAIDVGGNVGDYSRALKARAPKVEIHIFEPAKTNLAKLERLFGADPSVKINPFALSAAEGRATLFADAPGSGLGSLARRKLDHFGIELAHEEEVATIRFEGYWEQALGRRPIDILKLDIEGYELEALKGCGAALGATRAVQFEFGGCNIDTRTYFQDFFCFFNDRDYDVSRITPLGLQRIERYREIDEFFSTTNFIACNRRLG